MYPVVRIVILPSKLQQLIPLFWTSDDVSTGFQSKSGQPYSCLAEVYVMFPQIHLWRNTCWPLGGQYGSWVVLIHILANKHWWGSRPGPIVLQTNSVRAGWCSTRLSYAGSAPFTFMKKGLPPGNDSKEDKKNRSDNSNLEIKCYLQKVLIYF